MDQIILQSVTKDELIAAIGNVVETKFKELSAANNQKEDSNELISRKEVSKLLKVSQVSVYNWVKAGILQTYKIGNAVRFKKSEVLKACVLKKGGSYDN